MDDSLLYTVFSSPRVGALETLLFFARMTRETDKIRYQDRTWTRATADRHEARTQYKEGPEEQAGKGAGGNGRKPARYKTLIQGRAAVFRKGFGGRRGSRATQ